MHTSHSPDSDKGLGPCAVMYDQFIKDWLFQHTDTTTHTWLTKMQVNHTSKLFSNISKWLQTHWKHLDKRDAICIKQQMDITMLIPLNNSLLPTKSIKEWKTTDGQLNHNQYALTWVAFPTA
jgi:hypothetical protein